MNGSSSKSTNTWLPYALIGALLVSVGFVGWAVWKSRQSQAPAEVIVDAAMTPTVTTAPPPPPPPVFSCPLDGTQQPDKASTQKRAIVVQIDNLPEARPQLGLSQADIVYEAMAEGDITRYSAVFACHDADTVGPVRSARLIDLELVPEFDALLANSGSSEGTTEELEAGGIAANINEGSYPGAYRRTNDRAAPHDLMTSTESLRQTAAAAGFSDQSQLTGGPKFKGDTPPAAGQSLSTISIPYSQYADVSYKYDPASNGWLRFIGGEADVDALNSRQINARNVIIQFVPVEQSDILEDVNGNYGLRYTLTGSGKALIFRDGQVVAATWERASPSSLTTYYDATNRPVALNAGQTWVELVPPDFQATWG